MHAAVYQNIVRRFAGSNQGAPTRSQAPKSNRAKPAASCGSLRRFSAVGVVGRRGSEGPSGGPLGGRVQPTPWSSADQQTGNPACPGTENLQPNLGSATTAGVRMSSPVGFTPLVTQFTRAAKAASSSGTANP